MKWHMDRKPAHILACKLGRTSALVHSILALERKREPVRKQRAPGSKCGPVRRQFGKSEPVRKRVGKYERVRILGDMS